MSNCYNQNLMTNLCTHPSAPSHFQKGIIKIDPNYLFHIEEVWSNHRREVKFKINILGKCGYNCKSYSVSSIILGDKNNPVQNKENIKT